jgi:hypothetical protein
VPTPKRNGAGAIRRGCAGASAESMTCDGELSMMGREGTGGGGSVAEGGGGGGVRGRRTEGERTGLADIPRSVSMDGAPTVDFVGVDGSLFSSSTQYRGLDLDGVDAGVDEVEGGGVGKRSNVGLTIFSKKFESYTELLRLAMPVLASIVRSDAAEETLARDTSEGRRLPSKGMGSDENVRGIMPPASSSASAISMPFGGAGGADETMIEVEGKCSGDVEHGDKEEDVEADDDGEMYSVLTEDASSDRLPLSV